MGVDAPWQSSVDPQVNAFQVLEAGDCELPYMPKGSFKDSISEVFSHAPLLVSMVFRSFVCAARGVKPCTVEQMAF